MASGLGITVSQLAEEYVLYKIFNDKTAKNYIGIASLFEKNCKIDSIHEIDVITLSKWKRKILKSKTNNTFNTYLRHLRVLFKYAVEESYIESNPFAKISFAPSHKRLLKTVDVKIIKKAVSLLDCDVLQPGWFWKTVVIFLASTGIRRKQLISIKWRDIDFENKELLLSVEGSKNYREWKIPLNDHLIQDLLLLRDCAEKIHIVKESDQVFNVCRFSSKYKGREMSNEQLGGFFRRLSGKVGVNISPHRLRHTLGTQLAKKENANLFIIQDIFGHSDIRTTKLYVHTDTDDMRKMLGGLNFKY